MATATQKIVILADDKTGAAIASAVRNSQKLDTQLRKTGDTMRNTTRQSRAQFGQLGHQVQDIAVQLQMGMNPLMVFGQQGSQIASIFGTGGALMGGLIAVAAVIASQLAPALFEANKEMKDLKDSLLEAVGGFEDLNEEERRIVEAGLAQELDERRAAMITLNAELEKQRRIMDEANQAIATGKTNILAEENARKKAAKAITDINVKRMIEQRQLDSLIAKIKEFNDATMLPAISGRGVEPTIFGGETEKQLKAYADQVINNAVPATVKFEMAQGRLNMAAEKFGLSAGEVATELERLKDLYGLTAQNADSLQEANAKLKITMEDVQRNGIMAVEDGLVGLVDGTKTVKQAFADMAKSIISDLIRMQIRAAITIPLANALGIPMAPGRAMGGPVSGNKPYVVGERGPELFVPSGSGRVVPNNKMSGGSNNVVVNVNMQTGETSADDASKLGTLIGNVVKAELVRQKRPGGLLMAGA